MTGNPNVTHAVNAGVVTLTASSFWAHAPEVVTLTLGLLGIVWYCMQIADWLQRKFRIARQLQQSGARVATPILEERHGTDVAETDTD